MNELTPKQRKGFEEKIRSLKLYGWAGECGWAAIEINKRVFGGKGELAAGLNEFWLERGRWVGHIAVAYGGTFWDASGEILEEDLVAWGILDPDDPEYFVDGWDEDAAYKADIWHVSEDEVNKHMNVCTIGESVKPLQQLIESLVSEAITEMDTHRKHSDMDFDMSFEEWVSAMGGLDSIIREYDVDVLQDYPWIEDNIDEDEEDREEALEAAGQEEFATDLGNKYYEWQYKWEQLGEETPLTLYRCVSLNGPEDLKMNKLGVHWTTERSSAVCHWGHGAGNKYIIVAEVDFGDIDQEMTMYHNMHPYTGTDEQEVTLLPNKKIRLVALWGPNGQSKQMNVVGVT